MKRTIDGHVFKETKLTTAVKFGVTALLVASVSGCSITPQQLSDQQVMDQVRDDVEILDKVRSEQLATIETINVHEAIARAVRYNQDYSLKRLESTLAEKQLEVARMDMLPELMANAGYQQRSNLAASASATLINGQPVPNGTYSISQDKERYYNGVAFNWNILDFGLSYVRANQQADRFLIAKERERKVQHNIEQQARAAYWKAVSAEQLLQRVKPLLVKVEQALGNARQIEKKRLQKPLDALNYQRELLDIMRSLQTLERDLVNARTDLVTLMGLPPSTDIVLSDVGNTEYKVPELNIDMATIEQLALSKRPELLESHYQKRISQQDAKAALLNMLPGVKFNAGTNYDNNDFLLNNEWQDLSAQVSWNLFNLFKGPKAIEAAEFKEALTDQQRLAISMTVLTQVHLAKLGFNQALKEYQTSTEYLAVVERIQQQMSAASRFNRVGEMQLIREELNHVLAELRRDVAYSQLQNSYGRIFASMGMDLVPQHDGDIKQLSAAISQRVADWQAGDVDAVSYPLEQQGAMLQGAGEQQWQFSDQTFALSGSVSYEARQADGSALPTWLSFDAHSRTFIGNPPADVHGLAITVSANNGDVVSSDNVVLVLSDTNDQPMIDDALQSQLMLDSQNGYRYQIKPEMVVDLDGEALKVEVTQQGVFTPSALPEWLEFDNQTMTFRADPELAGENGLSVSLLLKATDAAGLTAAKELQLTIQPALETAAVESAAVKADDV